MLTPKERLQCALNGGKPDRPPCICPGGMMNMVTAQLMDEISVYLPHAHSDAGQMAALARAVYEKGCFENYGVPFCMTVEAEEMGAKVSMGSEVYEPHTSYYGRYFEMREKQCEALHNLHYEMEKIKQVPRQAAVIAEYIHYLSRHVTEMNDPENQLKRLEQLSNDMKKEELPKTREEFESRAVLYHILMDLEDFLNYKRQFVERIDDTQFQIYWKKEVEDFSSPSNI